MAGFITFLIIFLSGIFEITFLSNGISPAFIPDLMLLVVVFWAASEIFEQSWKKIVLAGLILDVFSFNILGFNAISFILVAFGVGSVAKRFLVSYRAWGFSVLLFLVAGATIGNILLLNILEKTYNFLSGSQEHLNVIALNDPKIFFKLISNLILFAIIYQPLKKIEKVATRIKDRQKGLI